MKSRRRVWKYLRLAHRLDVVVEIGVTLRRLRNEIGIWADLRAFPALAVIVGLDCVAGLVFERKLNGGPPLHLTNLRLLFAAFAVALLTVSSRWWLSRMEREQPAQWLRLLLAALCLLPMLALLSLANSQHSPWTISIATALAVASGSTILWWQHLETSHSGPVVAPAISITPARPRSTPVEIAVSATQKHAAAVPTTTAREAQIPDAREWTKRTTGEAGQITFEGEALAEFAIGQSCATVHISFQPPFDRAPEFACHVIGELPIRPRAPAVYRYGARVELRRTAETSQPVQIAIRFRATASAPNSSRAA